MQCSGMQGLYAQLTLEDVIQGIHHCCDALPISAISLKICTPKHKLFHNTE